jgi:hypothetical protein
MSFYNSKLFWVTGVFFTLAFLFLFSIRMGWLNNILSRPKTLSIAAISEVSERDTWMNIFQNDRKIGFSHSRFSKKGTGYRLQETVYMRINTMGMVQDINLKTDGRLKADFTLADLNFEINSGRFSFSVKGSVSDDILKIETASAGDRRTLDIRIEQKPYLFSGIIHAVAATKLKPGDKFAFPIFDPATMAQLPVYVEAVGQEEIQIMGTKRTATIVSLNFKGSTQLAWIDENGDLLKEKGLLGIRLERTHRKEALYGLALASSQDLTKTASVSSNVALENPDQLERLTIEVSGIELDQVDLQGGRQKFRFRENQLIIVKENLSNLVSELDDTNLGTLEKVFLQPTSFIQSDHQKIKQLTQEILGGNANATPLEKVQKLLNWVHQNIEKRPVLSLPDALSTLENRVGDCNEHAVLMAALSRAAGIPSRVEAGLVYLKGSFYYHAWNLVYLGRWITADALFGQLPADVSHIRFITGSQRQQLDLMGIIGKVQIKVIQ